MENEVLDSKLLSLRRCAARVREALPATRAALDGDFDRQDVVVLNLTRAVQLCVDIASHVLSGLGHAVPASMGEAFDGLHRIGWIDGEIAGRLRKSVAFRNVAVHAYRELDLDILYAVATRHLVDFEEFARQVARASRPD